MAMPFKEHETPGWFEAVRAVSSEEIVFMAKTLIQKQFARGQSLSSPDATREYLMLELATLEYEVFYCLYLDNQHRVLKMECCFQGTIDAAQVYPREIVKRALQLNASAVILAHNHPSGGIEPSSSDKTITDKLVQALKLVDIRVLDHFIVGGTDLTSFAERGLL